MKSRVILAVAVAAAALGSFADTVFAASSRSLFLPPSSASTSSGAAQRRPGSHYSVVAAELIRQCADLESQFDRALVGVEGARWTRSAVALRAQGGAACGRGEREAGIDQLRAAVRQIGAIPYATY